MRAPVTCSEEKQQAGLQVTHSMAGERTASRERLKVVQACEPGPLAPAACASRGPVPVRALAEPASGRSPTALEVTARMLRVPIMAARLPSQGQLRLSAPRPRLHNLKAQHVGQLGHCGYGSHNPRASCTAARGRLRLQPLCNREAPDGCCP